MKKKKSHLGGWIKIFFCLFDVYPLSFNKVLYHHGSFLLINWVLNWIRSLNCLIQILVMLWNIYLFLHSTIKQKSYFGVSHFTFVSLFFNKNEDFFEGFTFFTFVLTLPVPIRTNRKIKLNFPFHTSLWCLKRFYEGL